jgi:hypothetical protein
VRHEEVSVMTVLRRALRVGEILFEVAVEPLETFSRFACLNGRFSPQVRDVRRHDDFRRPHLERLENVLHASDGGVDRKLHRVERGGARFPFLGKFVQAPIPGGGREPGSDFDEQGPKPRGIGSGASRENPRENRIDPADRSSERIGGRLRVFPAARVIGRRGGERVARTLLENAGGRLGGEPEERVPLGRKGLVRPRRLPLLSSADRSDLPFGASPVERERFRGGGEVDSEKQTLLPPPFGSRRELDDEHPLETYGMDALDASPVDRGHLLYPAVPRGELSIRRHELRLPAVIEDMREGEGGVLEKERNPFRESPHGGDRSAGEHPVELEPEGVCGQAVHASNDRERRVPSQIVKPARISPLTLAPAIVLQCASGCAGRGKSGSAARAHRIIVRGSVWSLA